MKRTRDNHITTNSVFRPLALHLHGNQQLEEDTSKFFNLFINKMDGLSDDQFQGVHLNDIPIVDDLLSLHILLYDIGFVDGRIIVELARRGVQKYKNTVRLLKYNNNISYVNNIDAVSKLFAVLIVTLFSIQHSIWSDI